MTSKQNFEGIPTTGDVVSELNQRFAFIRIGEDLRVLDEEHIDDGGAPVYWKISALRDFMANDIRTIVRQKKDGDLEIAHVTAFESWRRHPERRSYPGGWTFDPTGKPTPDKFNLWRGFACEARPGNCGLWKDHLFEVICNRDQELYDWNWAWFARTVQHPGEAIGTVPILRGVRGTGKGSVAGSEIGIGSLFHQRHVYHALDVRELIGDFNDHLLGRVITFADEAVWPNDRSSWGRLQGLITEQTIGIHGKFRSRVPSRNTMHLICATNHDWSTPAGEWERRYQPLDVSDRHAQDRAYFGALRELMLEQGGREALLHELQNADLTRLPDPREILRTEQLFEQQRMAWGPFDSWWFVVLDEGRISHNPWSMGDSMEIPKQLLRESYLEVAHESGDRRPMGQERFAFALRKRLGLDGKLEQGRESNALRRRTYKLPPRAQARSAFAKHHGMAIDWPAESNDDEQGYRKARSGPTFRRRANFGKR